ncbi:MAG: type II toxin-antitoxin system RelE/ParE family toxin [Proteobacteria bacterium]|nr:type II toxin-antitoxin system RelE/ParE family toxin [Pseudomonadota bacterium]MBU1714640.1 type II toxin-antitoxin system RelE/ParE family toxin [Pseudomonadota bacterium]
MRLNTSKTNRPDWVVFWGAVYRTAGINNHISVIGTPSDKTTAAVEWIEALFDKVEILKSSPNIGRIVPESNREDIRKLLFGNYRIVYLVNEKRISILPIRHGKQILPIDEQQA